VGSTVEEPDERTITAGAGRPEQPWMPEGWGVEADNLRRFRAAVAGALAHLESRREEVNDLNVFPVADGDTGDNMSLTLRAVLEELDRLQLGNGARVVESLGREEIVELVARSALLGARGNSGVILSQLIRGAAEELVSRPGELIDPALIGAALLNAANRAYASVRDPAEGTILTVAREMAHQIVADVAHAAESTRLSPTTSPTEQDAVIAEALARALSVGEESVKHGPELLPTLREAGVVDAGGYALTLLFAGVVAALRGDEPPELAHHAPARVSHPEHQSSTYRYCTNFAVTGRGLVPGEFIDPLEELGDSVLVVGDARTLKVHVHTDDPERATAVFADAGEVSHLDVGDMRAQAAGRSQRLAQPAEQGGAGRSSAAGSREDPEAARCGAVAVVNGRGFAELFAELGVHTIDGGPTLNPSTYQVLAGIHEVDAEEVVVLPCSPNVMMAAERAAELSERQVAVVRVTSQQAAVVAAVALAAEHGVERNAHAIAQALSGVRTGAVAEAARDDRQGRFRQGDAVGFIADDVVAWGEPGPTLARVMEVLGGDAELLSVFAGSNAPLDALGVEASVDGLLADTELELRHGGQEAYWWLLAAE
jgi:DAK2 domain fusion protein YloV